jgi:hypothetical protein
VRSREALAAPVRFCRRAGRGKKLARAGKQEGGAEVEFAQNKKGAAARPWRLSFASSDFRSRETQLRRRKPKFAKPSISENRVESKSKARACNEKGNAAKKNADYSTRCT